MSFTCLWRTTARSPAPNAGDAQQRPPQKDKMTGIGFSHVKELIEITFGEGYTLEITSPSSIGTVVLTCFP